MRERFIAERLRRYGIRTQTVLAAVAAVFITAQVALLLRAPLSSYLLWAIVASVGAATVLSYSILAEYFPSDMAGQANAALNIFHIGGAFVLQYVIGLIIGMWSSRGGHYPFAAYEAAFATLVCLQAAALVWFATSELLTRNGMLRVVAQGVFAPGNRALQPRITRSTSDLTMRKNACDRNPSTTCFLAEAGAGCDKPHEPVIATSQDGPAYISASSDPTRVGSLY